MNLGSFVKEKRKSLRLGSRELGRLAGLSSNSISAIEAGKQHDLLLSKAYGLAKALGVSLDELAETQEQRGCGR